MTEIQTEEIETKPINSWTPTGAMTIREYFAINIFKSFVASGSYNTHPAVHLAHDLIEKLNSIKMPTSES